MDASANRAARIGAALSSPVRVRMLLSLLDGRPRSSTELAAMGGVGAATASAHLRRLLAAHLVAVEVNGRHRYYRLRGFEAGAPIEALCVLAGGQRPPPLGEASGLRAARSCYDHFAGILGVCLHDRLLGLGWLRRAPGRNYIVTPAGETGLRSLGLDLAPVCAARRRFAFGCLDWTERRWHLAGGLGAALLALALRRGWVRRELDSRALLVTHVGRRAFQSRLGLDHRMVGPPGFEPETDGL